MTIATTPANNAADNPHITEVRSILMAQMRALKAANSETLETELSKSKAINSLSQTLINSAKVEVDYLKETGQQQSKFLELPPDVHTGIAQSNTPRITRNNADTMKKRDWKDV